METTITRHGDLPAYLAVPDGAGPVWEVPIASPASLLPLNFPAPALRPQV